MMGWVRHRARSLSLGALFALALQLGLSFGHVHHDTAAAADAVITTTASSDAPAPESDPGHDDHRDTCAICLAATMAGNALAAAAPDLPAPPAFALLRTSLPDANDTANPRRAGFRSRAPPRA
jgi:hypothetical protein